MSKFANVPVEEDAVILFSLECQLGDRDVLYQKWHLPWDNITAESFIFDSDDVAKLSNAGLEKEARSSPMIKGDSTITIKRSDSGLTFVNFNFCVDSDEDENYVPEVLTPDELKEKIKKTRAAIGVKNQRVIEQIRINKLRNDST